MNKFNKTKIQNILNMLSFQLAKLFILNATAGSLKKKKTNMRIASILQC